MTSSDPSTGGPARAHLPQTGQRRRLALTAVPGPVGHGRRFARQALEDWGWSDSETRTDDILLIVSELLANACLHGGGPRELVLTASPAHLRVEVLDCEMLLPSPRPPHLVDAPGGHGLHIVQRLSQRWGAVAHGDGKAVWAEFDAARSPSSGRPSLRSDVLSPEARLGHGRSPAGYPRADQGPQARPRRADPDAARPRPRHPAGCGPTTPEDPMADQRPRSRTPARPAQQPRPPSSSCSARRAVGPRRDAGRR
ncbi:ATP-binding protein [Kitasatospora paranensis]|uniref:ATP-binding protein n=1 Tax=Kitasatospora paranensis TaxID=258053 RepID=UPI0031EB1EC3